MVLNHVVSGAAVPKPTGAAQPAMLDRELATWRAIEYDPNALLQSITMNGRYLKPILKNHTIASPNPNQGWSVSALLKDVFGNTTTCDIFTMLNEITLWTLDDDPPGADVVIGCGIADGPVQTATTGFAVALIKSGSDWKVRKYVCAAGTWTATDATVVSSATVGARLILFNTNSNVQRGCAIQPFDANLAPITTSNVEPTNTASSTQGSPYTHIFCFAGWQTGSGGSEGQAVQLRGSEMIMRMTQVQGAARANPPS